MQPVLLIFIPKPFSSKLKFELRHDWAMFYRFYEQSFSKLMSLKLLSVTKFKPSLSVCTYLSYDKSSTIPQTPGVPPRSPGRCREQQQTTIAHRFRSRADTAYYGQFGSTELRRWLQWMLGRPRRQFWGVVAASLGALQHICLFLKLRNTVVGAGTTT